MMQIVALLQQQLQMQQLRNSFESHGTTTNHPHNLYVSTLYPNGFAVKLPLIPCNQSTPLEPHSRIHTLPRLGAICHSKYSKCSSYCCTFTLRTEPRNYNNNNNNNLRHTHRTRIEKLAIPRSLLRIKLIDQQQRRRTLGNSSGLYYFLGCVCKAKQHSQIVSSLIYSH